MGVALISIGLSLITLSDNSIKKITSSVIFAFFSFIQRTVYILIAGVVTIGGELQNRQKKVNVILIPVFIILLYFAVVYFEANESADYASGYIKYVSALAIPLKIVLGLIGPFPWSQFMLALEGHTSFAYHPADYLLGVFQLGYLICIIANFRKMSFRNLDYSTLMGFGMMISGLMTSMMHIGYIAEGLFFTLPWFFKQVGSDYRKYFILSFVFLVLLNVFVTLFGISGISSMWR